MKKLKYISFVLIGFLSLASCESELDTAPTDQASSVEVFKTAESAETVVNGTGQNLIMTEQPMPISGIPLC